MHDRELDYGLRRTRRTSSRRSTPPSSGSRTARTASARNCGEPIGEERLEALPWADLCIDCSEAAMSEPAPGPPSTCASARRQTRWRPSRSRSARTAAGAHEWIGLGAVAGAAVVADQVTKRIVAGTLDLDRVATRRRAVLDLHHVQNSGIAFGLFASATTIVMALTAMAVGWMLVFFARSGARHPVLPVGARPGGRRQRLEPRRPHPARARHRLPRPRLLAGVQPRRHLHRRRVSHPARSRAAGESRASPASKRVPADAAGERLDRFLASLDGVGSRAEAERLLERAGRGTVDGERAPKSYRRPGGRGDRVRGARARGRGRARTPRRSRRSASRTRTSTCSSSTSRRASSSTRAPATRPGRSCTALVAPRRGRRRGGAAGDRPPARPRHLGAARRRALGRGVRAPSGARAERASSSASTSRSSAGGRARAPAGSRRRSAATAATPTRQSLDTDTPRDAVTHFELEELPAASTRCFACGSRRGGRTRSASTSPRSTCRSSATRSTASRGELGLERQFLHAARLAFTHPITASGSRSTSPLPPDLAAALARLASRRLRALRLVEPLVGEAEERVRRDGVVREVRETGAEREPFGQLARARSLVDAVVQPGEEPAAGLVVALDR